KAFLRQGPNGRGGRIKLVDLVFLDDLPEPAIVRIGGNSLEQHGGRTVGQWSVNDIGMSGDPTYVRRTPEHVLVPVLEHIFKGICREHHIASGGVDLSFGPARGTGGIKDVQR